MKLPLPTEKSIQQICINYLELKGFYVQRMNSGAIPVISNGKKRVIRLAVKGTPDIMAFKPDKGDDGTGYPCGGVDLYFFEIKVPGRRPTFIQEHMMKELERFGAKCFVIHSLEELQKVI